MDRLRCKQGAVGLTLAVCRILVASWNLLPPHDMGNHIEPSAQSSPNVKPEAAKLNLFASAKIMAERFIAGFSHSLPLAVLLVGLVCSRA